MPLQALLLLWLAGFAPGLAGAAFSSEAQGFGASSRGGEGGRVLLVWRLDDDPQQPQRGSLRWALQQPGARIVRFAVGGDVRLRGRIVVHEPFLTLDGSTAPEPGVCLRGGSLEFRDTHDLIVRRLRIRLGDDTMLEKLRRAGKKRPRDSGGLDCVSLDNSQRVLFDHCSVSWSCDELFGITHCRDVTIQWCLLSEPLGDPHLHPYGDNHAFCVNASASTLSIHHCLFHRFVMRGPQFECNDMRAADDYSVRMEAVNNVVSGYTRSGSRYSTGVEKRNGVAKGKSFEFQFLGNLYLPGAGETEPIEAITKHGHDAKVSICCEGNLALDSAPEASPPRLHPLSHKGPMPALRLSEGDIRGLRESLAETRALRDIGEPRFTAPVPVERQPAKDACLLVLQQAGDSSRDDPVDARIRREVLELTSSETLRSTP